MPDYIRIAWNICQARSWVNSTVWLANVTDDKINQLSAGREFKTLSWFARNNGNKEECRWEAVGKKENSWKIQLFLIELLQQGYMLDVKPAFYDLNIAHSFFYIGKYVRLLSLRSLPPGPIHNMTVMHMVGLFSLHNHDTWSFLLVIMIMTGI